MRPAHIGAVVFDVGGVLIDWNPRYLYRKLIPDEAAMERFLSEICTLEWHVQHDLGASYDETIPALVAEHPEWADEIRAWHERFGEMYGGCFDGTVALLEGLHARRVRLVAATNWGAESWLRIKAQYPFLDLFEGALVSGEVGLAKPDPAFFALLVESFDLVPAATLYVEDNAVNLRAAAESGFVAHLFESAEKLAEELVGRGLLGS
jgi:2-haloacid dehalogenase